MDPLDKLEKETPLHKAVKYANFKDTEVGEEVVELLLDAGADPRFVFVLPFLPFYPYLLSSPLLYINAGLIQGK